MLIDQCVKECRQKLARCQSLDLVKAYQEVQVVAQAIGNILNDERERYEQAAREGERPAETRRVPVPPMDPPYPSSPYTPPA